MKLKLTVWNEIFAPWEHSGSKRRLSSQRDFRRTANKDVCIGPVNYAVFRSEKR